MQKNGGTNIHTLKTVGWNAQKRCIDLMAAENADFWSIFETAQRHAFGGAQAEALESIAQAEAAASAQDSVFGQERRDLLNGLRQFLKVSPSDLPAEVPTDTGPINTGPDETGPLGAISAQGQDGISLVTCAMNRTDNLLKALSSWVACPEISEIVIVDWASDQPVAAALARAGLSDPRIRVVRVEGEARWILSYAFNVGFRLSRFNRILKVDADIVLMPDFFARNPMSAGHFIAGNWRTAKKDQVHINGFFFVDRAHLAAAGGFNEYITTYGWDDDDLYERLVHVGAHRRDVNPDTIHHQAHSDIARTGKTDACVSDAFTEVTSGTMYCIRRNRFLANVMPYWDARRTHVLYTWGRGPQGQSVLRRGDVLPHTVPAQIEADADYYALLELASWRLGPRTLELDRTALRRLLAQPFERLGPKAVEAALAGQVKPHAPAVTVARPRLFIDAQHGLGNRMRAIASAGAIAEASGRELVIVWAPDHHCEGRMADLFDYDGAVIEEAFVSEAATRGCQVYNYMEVEDGAKKDAPLDLGWGGDIYARAAYVLNADPSTWESENRFLRGLQPNGAVRNLLDRVRTPNDVSAHVRMVGGTEYEHLAYEAVDNWTEDGHAQTDFWRRKSHFSHFIARLDTLIAEGRAERIFLAADTPETYDAFTRTFGSRVAYLERAVYDRSAEQLRYALADALLLGSSPMLLGSTWSSFSELAQRLSEHKMAFEMSGKDF